MISYAVMDYLIMEHFSEQYGWTPQQIKDMDPDDSEAYMAILRGKANREKNKKGSPVPQAVPKGMIKKMHGLGANAKRRMR